MSTSILSWNILSGGFKDYGSPEDRPDRLGGLALAIKKLNADIVGLVDTHRWTEVFTQTELKEIFGYPFVHCVKLEDKRLITKGHDNGVTVFSKLPDTKLETVCIATRNCIKVSTPKLDFFSTYLDDLDEDVRLKQVTELLNNVDDKPTIIAGDLNTFDSSDLESSNSAIDELSAKYPGPMKGMKPTLNQMMRAEVTKMLKENKFVDLGSGKGNTVPAKLFPLKTEKPVIRLDYAFGKKVNLESFEVLTDDQFGNLSDHYPIFLKIS